MNLPNKFTFVSPLGTSYTATKNDLGYLVSWVEDSRQYCQEDVHRSVVLGIWKNVKEVKEKYFSIKEGSIESAARFIVANNNNYQPYANISECEESIKRCISRMVERIKRGEEAYRCSTGGWTLLIDKEDEDYYVVEVLVDTLVSQDREFVNVEDVL